LGVILNNRRMRACFFVWLVSNAIMFGIHAWVGIWSLAIRDGIFLVLAVEGWYRWGKISEKRC
jgi:nicotinamide riboside transporter PnuC